MRKIPVVFDTDPGVDDFFAIMMLGSAADKYDFRAITTVPGNQTLAQVSHNALGIRDLLHLDCRVAMGSEHHMLVPLDIPTVHGPTGLGNVELDAPSGRGYDPMKAWDVIYDEAKKAGGELELWAVGPLTNLGIAFLKYPDLKTMIRRIVIMGGSTTAGNMSAFGEANIYHDPHAAAIVWKTGVAIDMVGLNALPPCSMTRDEMEPLMPETLNPKVRKVCLSLADFRQGFPLCDCVTVVAELYDGFAHWEWYHVDVEHRSRLSMGQTVVDYLGSTKKARQTRVAITTDRAIYFEAFKKMFAHYCY